MIDGWPTILRRALVYVCARRTMCACGYVSWLNILRCKRMASPAEGASMVGAFLALAQVFVWAIRQCIGYTLLCACAGSEMGCTERCIPGLPQADIGSTMQVRVGRKSALSARNMITRTWVSLLGTFPQHAFVQHHPWGMRGAERGHEAQRNHDRPLPACSHNA